MVNNKPHVMLDLDGVLATTTQYNTNNKKWHPIYDCYRFDKKCVEVFNSIIEKVNPIIILSSDWKHHYTITQMNEIFEWNGINSIISDYTPYLWGLKFFNLDDLEKCRANEILKFVEKNKIEKWIAIDDLDLSPWIDENHFVRTPRANEGIKQSGVKDKILKILNK